MSQQVFPDINPTTTSGIQLATLLNQFKAALMSGLKGGSRPSELLAGGMWLDDSQAGSPNFLWRLKLYDGTTDRTLLTLNLATGNVILSGSEDEFSIQKISDDAVGALLKLSKQRDGGDAVEADDVIGEFQFYGRDSDGNSPLVALMKVVSGQNMTETESSAYFDIEGTTHNTASRSVFARIRNAMMAIGAGFNPENTVHARGTTGIKSERLADDASGAQVIVRKRRISGTGATQSGDVIGTYQANSTDDTTTEATTAEMRAEAVENHTSTALGTKWVFRVIAATANSLSSVMEVGSEIKSLVLHSIERLKLNSQDVATAATITQLSADKALVRMTGSTATAIRGIDSAAGKTKVIVIHNTSSADITCLHASEDAAEADRFSLPSNRDIKIKPGSSGEFFYDETSYKWKVKSGSGSGGGEVIVSGSRSTPNDISAAGGITASSSDLETLQYVQGDGGHVEISANPQISAGFQDGQKLRLIGRNDEQTLTFVNGNGVVTKSGGNLTLSENTVVDFVWDTTNWVQV